MASGFKSGSLPHLKYYDELINLPTLHIYGQNDQIIPKGKNNIKYVGIFVITIPTFAYRNE